MFTFNQSKTFNFNRSKRYLGVELEFAYTNISKQSILNDIVDKWNGELGHDGSIISKRIPVRIKNLDNVRLELRTAPTNGDLFIKQMLEYGAALRDTKSAANDTCGLHVHIDARDLTNQDLDKVLMLWSKVERPMFSLVQPIRALSKWCHPWKFSSEIKKIERKISYEAGSDYVHDSCGGCDNCLYYEGRCTAPRSRRRILAKIKNSDYDLERYKSLNLVSLNDLGTLENRMHHGTTNVDNIINWALINASIVDYAKSHSMIHISKLTRGFDTLLSVTPSDTVKAWATARKEDWKTRPVVTQYKDQINDSKWR